MRNRQAVEASVFTPLNPALPGPEAVEALRMACEHRRSTMNIVRKPALLSARDKRDVAGNSTGHSELSQRIAALNGLSAQQLRDEWRRLYRGQPPRLSRDLLIRTIAYRMHELDYGGLSKATQRKLDALTKELEVKGSIVITPIHLLGRARGWCESGAAERTRWS